MSSPFDFIYQLKYPSVESDEKAKEYVPPQIISAIYVI
jgi:hypothetical protein